MTRPPWPDLFEAVRPHLRFPPNSRPDKDGWLTAFCPFHDDREHPNLRIHPAKGGFRCLACGASGNLNRLAQHFGVDDQRPNRKPLAVYDYRDEHGGLLYQVVRKPGKRFQQRRPNDNGGWAWNLDGVRRIPYRLPELMAADLAQWVHITEGEKDADNLARLGLVATTNSGGAGKWPTEIATYFTDRRVAILPDADAAGQAHALDVAAKLAPYAAEVKIVHLPGLPDKGDVSEWLAHGHTAEELVALVDAAPICQPHMHPSDVAGKVAPSVSGSDTAESAPATLADVEDAFRKWLLMPDMGGLRFALAILVGHRIGGDPLWGLLVAPPSGTKTEIIRSLEAVPGIYPLSELTARTFASGLEGGKRETSLLPRLSDHVLTLKDFTTVLTMHREERQAILAQLREIYDGRFDKVWGTGKELHWRGRVGFLAGVTPIIDLHHAVHQVLGERFILYRLGQPDRRTMAVRALRGRGREEEMRHELRGIVARFMGSLDFDTPPNLPSAFEGCLAALADFISRARSGVVRERYSRDLTLAPEPEAPARLAKQLASLAVGHAMIREADVEFADYAFVYRVALDCLPQVRLQTIDALEGESDYIASKQVAAKIGYPTTTARRTLEDLAALGIVAVSKAEKQGQADNWQLTEEARELLDISTRTLSPESAPDTESGGVPATSGGYAQ